MTREQYHTRIAEIEQLERAIQQSGLTHACKLRELHYWQQQREEAYISCFGRVTKAASEEDVSV